MKNLIFKKQLIILISVFILVAGISAVSANENTTDLHQSMHITVQTFIIPHLKMLKLQFYLLLNQMI